MATSNGSASSDFHSRALAYVAIPLAVVVSLGVVAMVLHTQRRKRLLKRRLQYVGSNPGARRALERDLQEAWMRGTPPEERRQQQRRAMGRWNRNNANGVNGGGRWAWARELLTARGEEGLNEFGEAPPPYDGRRRGSKIQGEGDVVELEAGPSGPGSGSGAMGGIAPGTEGDAGQSSDQQRRSTSEQGQPPAYEGPPGAAHGAAPITVPAPALTHDARLSRVSA
ncbi:hypothetical protein NKR19_g5466 [Coniochaeta hoffmannii]|uniref:Uncharacterized protein n=1 Tax=Coniochaeta hoffmannii TaxID=91930 RepID=A0AA38RT37_9PEZI|nr:hypothetical protein NKR19_g5466 [Coniochaeta hoffmannii]